MKNRAMLASMLFVITLLASMVSMSYARDARYESFGSPVVYPAGDDSSGNWQCYGNTPDNSFYLEVTYGNNFAAAQNHQNGFEHISMRFSADNQDMGYDNLWARMYVFAEEYAADLGGGIKMQFSSHDRSIHMKIIYPSGYEVSGQDNVIDDFFVYDPYIEVKFNIAKDVINGCRKFHCSVELCKINRSTGQITMLEWRWWGGNTYTVPNLGKFHHRTYVWYGDVPRVKALWHTHFNLIAIGVRQDLALEDCGTDICDVVIVNSNYGKKIATGGGWDWFWGSTAWKADCDASGEIDIYDVTYITSHYDEYW